MALTHFGPPLRFRNQFLPTVPTFAVRETDVCRHNGGTRGSPIMPRDAVSRTANVGTVGTNQKNHPRSIKYIKFTSYIDALIFCQINKNMIALQIIILLWNLSDIWLVQNKINIVI